MIDRIVRFGNNKGLKKKIKDLKKELKRLELRPCRSDLELKEKEIGLKVLEGKIDDLERVQTKSVVGLDSVGQFF